MERTHVRCYRNHEKHWPDSAGLRFVATTTRKRALAHGEAGFPRARQVAPPWQATTARLDPPAAFPVAPAACGSGLHRLCECGSCGPASLLPAYGFHSTNTPHLCGLIGLPFEKASKNPRSPGNYPAYFFRSSTQRTGRLETSHLTWRCDWFTKPPLILLNHNIWN
jgi:hypothetical protein